MNTPRPEDGWTMPPQPPPQATGPSAPAPPARRSARFRWAATPVAVALAALLAGGGIVYAVDHHASATASTGSPQAAVPGPNGFGGGAGGPGGLGGPIAGEQHVQGTVSAKTATTVTVKSGNGTATYTVNDSTEIVRNGQAATLAAVQVGDPVLVHVYPSSSGRLLVERLFAGSSAADGGPGGLGPGGVGPPSGGSGSGGTGSQGGLTT
jgi:Domain of unknown function (DUF5666)